MHGKTPGYELHPANDIWRQAEAPKGTHDLTLEAPSFRAGAYVVTIARTDWTLDDVVASRRDALLRHSATSYDERRFFLDESHLIPAALQRASIDKGTIEALSVITSKGTFVVIGFTPAGGEDAVHELVTSLRVDP